MGLLELNAWGKNGNVQWTKSYEAQLNWLWHLLLVWQSEIHFYGPHDLLKLSSVVDHLRWLALRK